MSEEKKDKLVNLLIVVALVLFLGPNFWGANKIDADEFVKASQQSGGIVALILAKLLGNGDKNKKV